MLLRIIIICLIALWIYRFVRRLLPPPPHRPSRVGNRPAPAVRAEMLRCGSCGMFITRASAIMSDQTPYCSMDCARNTAKQRS